MTEFEQKYYVDRRGSDSAKWDGLQSLFKRTDLMPFWVADMDFRCPDGVRAALMKMAEYNLYGYYSAPPAVDEAFIGWEKSRHGYQVKREWLRNTPGVVSGIYRLINAFTQPGDACIILSPCYYPFMNAVSDCGRRLVCSMLKNDAGYYSPDPEDFERNIVSNSVRLFILCSPHNPVGRVWTKNELAALLDICRRHGVIVISDEIHQDILLGGSVHVPTAMAAPCDDLAVTLTAPSKTFNLAGMSFSYMIAPDAGLLKRYDKYIKTIHGGLSTPARIAARAAYETGAQWLDGLLAQLNENALLLREILSEKLPGAVLSPLQGTYLQWIDLSAYVTAQNIKEKVQDTCGLAVDYGSWFFTPEDGSDDCHIRVNLATGSGNVIELAERLAHGLK